MKLFIKALLATMITAAAATVNAGDMPKYCSSQGEINNEAKACEGMVSYYDNAGVEGLSEEAKELSQSLVAKGCSNTCGLSGTESVSFGKRLNGQAYASVVFTGVK